MSCAVLILNWNGGKDTVDCLRSLLPSLEANDYVFIIDNGSVDESVTIIKQFLESEAGGCGITKSEDLLTVFNVKQKFYLCQNKTNLGFGGGNNTVLKQLLKLAANFEMAWLLNNDAFADNQSLPSLKKALQGDQKIAVAGSLILNFPATDTVQCTGVKHYKWIGVSKLINKNLPLDTVDLRAPIAFDYLNGASLMLRLEALELCGYFDESFFLYSEELDLQLRMQEKGYLLYLDLESKVRHKLSGGTSSNRSLFYYYYNASAILLNRKHYSRLVVLISVIGLMAITVLRAFPSFKNIKGGFAGIYKGLTKE
ncbi:MAG: glycosyltransferase family 2 protein [bacterium]|nr:glycosyltransferase family 2 protein [bacterium]